RCAAPTPPPKGNGRLANARGGVSASTPLRQRLRRQRELHRRKAARLRYRRLGAVADILDQRSRVGQGDVAAVDARDALVVDEEQVVAAGGTVEVDVLAQLHVTGVAENRQPPVAPRRQAVGREPVHTRVTGDVAGAQQHLAEILQLRGLRV